MNNNYNIVLCYLKNGKIWNKEKAYAFKAFDEVTSKYVLLDNSTGYAVGEVVEVLTQEEYKERYDSKTLKKEMVCNLNMIPFLTRREVEKRSAALKRQMDEYIMGKQETEKYQYFAERYPDMKAMFEEYMALSGGVG